MQLQTNLPFSAGIAPWAMPASFARKAAAPRAVDLFAGGGGFSTGAAMAGVHVVWAANHWPLAVEIHKINHPDTLHACQDLQQADWSLVAQHDILLASPCCQGFSNARGTDRPHHDLQRSTAWAVISAAEYHRPQLVVVENVVEFMRWVLYPSWLDAVQRLGYTVAPHYIDAADHGVPQNRLRLYLVCTRSKAPLNLKLPKREHRTARSFIDFAAGKWTPINRPGRSAATLRRIERGYRELGTSRFLAPFYGSGSGATGRSLDRPIGTITTRDRWAVIDLDCGAMRMVTKEETRTAMGFPEGYLLPRQHKPSIHLLGNAVCPPVPADILIAAQAQA